MKKHNIAKVPHRRIKIKQDKSIAVRKNIQVDC